MRGTLIVVGSWTGLSAVLSVLVGRFLRHNDRHAVAAERPIRRSRTIAAAASDVRTAPAAASAR